MKLQAPAFLRTSLRARLIASYGLVAAVPLLVFLVLVGRVVEREMERGVTAETEGAATVALNYLSENGDTLRRFAGRLAAARTTVDAIQARDEGRLTYQAASYGTDFDLRFIQILDGEGRRLAEATAAGRNPLAGGARPAERSAAVQEALSWPFAPFWDLEKTEGGLLLRAVEPVFPLVGRARPIGAVTVAQPLDSEFAETMKRLANAEIRIFRGDGVVATTLFTERRTRKTEETLSASVAAGVQARTRVHRIERAGPFAYEVVYMPLADARGRLVGTLAVGVSRYLVDRLQRITRITIIVLTVIVLGLAAILGILSADRITRPVRELIAGTQRVAAGEYDFTIRAYLEDEIGALAKSFNAMIFGLRERRLLRDAFGKYMSPRVAEEILTRPGGVRLAGERRDVSVFFTDVRGFTALSGSQPPEEIVRLLNVHFTLLVDIVFAHEGTVDKFTGDGLMAVFGAPLDQPDHAARALRCAVDIQRALQKERERGLYQGAAPLAVGIGVASGEAVVGDIGAEKRREYSVIGDCVNLAARLMGIAESDGILASPETARQADGAVPLKRREPVKLKGMATPLEVFEVIWPRPAA